MADAPAPEREPKQAKPKPKGIRRVLRWIRRLGLGALGIALLVLGASIAVINTDWGRDLMRRRLESMLKDQFPGGAKIGRIEGSLFNTLTAFDIELDGRDGKPMVQISALTIEVALRPLVSEHVRVDSLVIDGLVVDIHPQPPGPPEPPAPPVPPPSTTSGAPSAWAIDLPRIEVHGARIAIELASGTSVHLDGVDLAAAVSVPAPEGGARTAPPIVASLWTHGVWRERGPFDVSTVLGYDRASTEVTSSLLAVALAGASATGLGLRAKLGDVPSAAGALAVHIPRGLLIAFGLPPTIVESATLPGTGDIDLVVDAAPRFNRAVPGTALAGANLVQVALSAAAGPAQLHGLLDVDLGARSVRGILRADEADLSALTNAKVRGHAQVIAALDANRSGVRGVLTLTGDVDVAPPMRMIVAVEATRERAILTASAAGVDDARVAALVEIQRAGDAYTLARGRLTVRSRDPARATQGRLPVHGTVFVDARARGPLWPEPKLIVDADAGADNLVYAAFGATKVRTHVEGYSIPASPDAYIHLDVTGARSGGAGIADASLELHALAAPGEPIRIDLKKHQVHTLANVLFAGAGGAITIARDGTKIDVRGLATGVGTSRITASGTYAPKTADFSAKLDIADLLLGTVMPELAGTAGAAISVARRGGRWSGGGDVHARGVVAQGQPPPGMAGGGGRGSPPIDADVHFDIAGTHVSAHATLSNPTIFAASVDVDLDGPRDLADVAGWRRLPRPALHGLALAIQRLDVDAALVAAGRDPAALPVHGGGVTGQVELTEQGAIGELDVRDVHGPSGTIDGTLQFAPGDPAEVAATGKVAAADVGEVGFAAHAVLPAHLFDPAEWAALDRGALRGAQVTLADQPFDPVLLARFGVVSLYRGRASLALETTAGFASTTLVADLHDVTGGVIAHPISLHAGATLDPNGIATTLSVETPKTRIVEVSGHSPVTFDRWVALGAAAATGAPLTGEITIGPLKLPEALAILDRSDILSGELSGAITLGGTVLTPTAEGSVAATGVTVSPGLGGHALPRLDDLTIALHWGGVAGTATAVAHESAGGMLSLRVAGGLADPSATTMDLVATSLDLAPLAAFAPERFAAAAGSLDANLHLTGLDPRAGHITGRLHLAKGRVPLAPKVGTLRQLDATIDVAGSTLQIKADGLLGAGDVHLTGTVGLIGAAAHDADLTLKVHKVAPIGGVQPVIDGDVHALLIHDPGQWTGKVLVTHASVVVPTETKSTKLLASGEPSDMEFVDAPPPPPKAIHLDAPANPWIAVTVDLAPTQVVVDEIRVVVKASGLKVSYGDEVGLDGYVDADTGDVELFGRRYQVELALLMFDGGTDPELSVSVSHAFPEVTTYTDVSGRLSEPILNLHADPQLYTQGQLLGFLLGGEPGGDPSSQARDEAATVGASLVSAQLSRRLNKVMPVKLAVRCNPSTSTASALCTAGKWINQKLYVGYQQHLDPRPDENSGEVELEYYFLTHFVIDVNGGDRNDGIDVLWRRRW